LKPEILRKLLLVVQKADLKLMRNVKNPVKALGKLKENLNNYKIKTGIHGKKLG
jgi:hypothetical protein